MITIEGLDVPRRPCGGGGGWRARSTATALSLSLSLSVLWLGCSGDGSAPADDSGAETGAATVALTEVPAGVGCVQIAAQGSRTRQQAFDVIPGEASLLPMTGLPVGAVTFSGQAFAGPCAAVPAAAVPAYVADPQMVQIVPGAVAEVALLMRQNGRASVAVDFEGAGGAGGGGDPIVIRVIGQGAVDNPLFVRERGAGAVLFIALDPAPAGTVTVTLTPEVAGAVALLPPALTFAPGDQGPKLVGVIGLPDPNTVQEDDVTIRLSAPGTAGDAFASVRVFEDDSQSIDDDVP